jgi:hypothetical protein
MEEGIGLVRSLRRSVPRPIKLRARRALDLVQNLDLRLRRTGTRLDRLAGNMPRRSVVVLGIYQRDPGDLDKACEELLTSRHQVELWLGSTSHVAPALAPYTQVTGLTGRKVTNTNSLWASWRRQHDGEPDWMITIDDDVLLPPGFLDRFLALCEHFDFTLAGATQTHRSYAAWGVMRRHWLSLARQTRYVEIGPVTAFRPEAVNRLFPMPPLYYGWGIDQHWAAVAEQENWRIGVVDATPIRHERNPIGASYSRGEAGAEAERFLAAHPHLTNEEANTTLRTYRRI